MIRVAVAGALGRMGALTREVVCDAAGVEYAGGFARARLPEEWIDDDLARLLRDRQPDVLVDFTVHPTSVEVATAAVTHGVSPVIGTSGWTPADRAALGDLARERSCGALLVPNFALGAVLMMKFAQEAARYFPSAEIVEMHHASKRDKPSGTAGATAERIAAGGGPASVPIHSVRMEGLLSHQEVLFGNTGELLTIRHDSFSYQSFAAGILYAIEHVRALRGLSVGLDSILGIATGGASQK